MTQDEFIEMAKQAGIEVKEPSWGYSESYSFSCFEEAFERFANLVAQRAQAEEREAWSEEIIDDLHALYDSEMIKENDSGDALIRLDEAVCVVEEVAQRNTNLPKQEAKDKPVAWREFDGEGGYDYYTYEHNEDLRDKYIERNGEKYASWVEPLYTEPPQRTWVGLDDDDINSVRYKRDWTAPWTDTTFARAIEAKLKEKNA